MRYLSSFFTLIFLAATAYSPTLFASSFDTTLYLEIAWEIPKDRNEESGITLEIGLEAEHQSGLYLEASLTSHDFNDNQTSFSDDSLIEINPGFAFEIADTLELDLGFTYEQPLDFDRSAEKEIYLGTIFAWSDSLELEAYFFKALDEDNYLELTLTHEWDDSLELYGTYTYELQESDGQTLELGVKKSFLDRHRVSAAVIADLKEWDESELELKYRFLF